MRYKNIVFVTVILKRLTHTHKRLLYPYFRWQIFLQTTIFLLCCISIFIYFFIYIYFLSYFIFIFLFRTTQLFLVLLLAFFSLCFEIPPLFLWPCWWCCCALRMLLFTYSYCCCCCVSLLQPQPFAIVVRFTWLSACDPPCLHSQLSCCCFFLPHLHATPSVWQRRCLPELISRSPRGYEVSTRDIAAVSYRPHQREAALSTPKAAKRHV